MKFKKYKLKEVWVPRFRICRCSHRMCEHTLFIVCQICKCKCYRFHSKMTYQEMKDNNIKNYFSVIFDGS